MILFTCLNSERTRALQEENNLDIALAVLQACRRYPESEWMFLIVTNHLLKCPELVKAMYARLSNQERTMLLELALSEISDKNSAVCKETDMFLASCFQEKCQSVLRLASAANNEDEEALLTLRLLDALCEMTSNDGQLEHLQACPGLLETAVTSVLCLYRPVRYFPFRQISDKAIQILPSSPSNLLAGTLQLTHLSGKQATNVFTAIHSATGQEQISHPAVGFKSHLIRLIANLCYRNKANQDKVYELDGIPLILDNCSIDDNNPFISQWAVYAIHNLTEQNERNQEIISQMERQGLADSSILEKTGLKMEEEDKKLILKSIRKIPDL